MSMAKWLRVAFHGGRDALQKQPAREAKLGQGADAGACHTGFPDQANKFPNVPI